MVERNATDRAILIRRAAARADALRSIMPLAATEEAVATVIGRKLIERRSVPRGANMQGLHS